MSVLVLQYFLRWWQYFNEKNICHWLGKTIPLIDNLMLFILLQFQDLSTLLVGMIAYKGVHSDPSPIPKYQLSILFTWYYWYFKVGFECICKKGSFLSSMPMLVFEYVGFAIRKESKHSASPPKIATNTITVRCHFKDKHSLHLQAEEIDIIYTPTLFQ